MPIDKEEFKKEGLCAETTKAKVEDFLKMNKDKAFAEYEILKNIYNIPENDPIRYIAYQTELKSILNELIEEGKIEVREIGDKKEKYYSWKD